jgi:hypothetical protein
MQSASRHLCYEQLLVGGGTWCVLTNGEVEHQHWHWPQAPLGVPDNDVEQHSTHIHAYEQLVGWIMGVACFGSGHKGGGWADGTMEESVLLRCH